MQYPKFYDPKKVGTLFKTRNNEVAAAGVQYAIDNDIAPASEDAPGERIALVIVDGQVDFIHEDGALSVKGAVADTRRTIEWIYANIGKITSVKLSLDSHVPLQIFSPLYWFNRKTGAMPDPMTMVTSQDYRLRNFVARYAPEWNANWNAEYIAELETRANKPLMLWSIHCLIGTPGYAIDPSLFEAVLFWAAARETNPEFLVKGDDFFTEHYAIQRAEVPNPKNANTLLNTAFMNALAEFDIIYVVGQAKSHCVFETINVMVDEWKHSASYILPRIRIGMDATSSVPAVYAPDGSLIVDFEALVAPTYQQWEQMGLVLDTLFDGNQPKVLA